MNKLINAINYLVNDRWRFLDSLVLNLGFMIPDKLYLNLRYRAEMGHWVNFENPKTFTEKIQWLKLYNRKPEYTTMVDKYAVKDYVASIIGPEYIIPTIGVWNTPEEIDWETLPSRFVLKTTHGGGGGGVVICKDKNTFDKADAIMKLSKNLKGDIYRTRREWPYKNVPHRIIAEEFMEETGYHGDLADYKFFCFNGEPKYCQVIRDRNTKETIDFYDMEWNHQNFVGLNPIAQNGTTPVAQPENLKVMQDVCRRLAKGIPFVRVDLYVINGKEYFGELTFFPASGLGSFSPDQWNEKLGDLLKLHGENGGGISV